MNQSSARGASLDRLEKRHDEPGVGLLNSPILVVDDSALSRSILGACLQGAGYCNIVFASDGREALTAMDTMAAGMPDLVILDLEMPVMDGFELCRHLRQDETSREIPVLIQSGRDSPDDLVRAFDCGASDMVLKPIKKFELLARVRVHLEKRLLLRQLLDYRERVAKELTAARNMQAALCPMPALIRDLGKQFAVSINHHYESCSELGGDIWGLEAIDDRHLGFFIADLSGHGVAAAMNTVRLHSVLSRQAMPCDDPAGFLADINRDLYGEFRRGEFATMLCGSLDVSSGRLIYASAGAPPPILMSRDSGETADFCPSNGMPAGLKSDPQYQNHQLDLLPGNQFLLFSDALIETPVDGGGPFDEAGLIELVRTLARETGEASFFDVLIRTFKERANGPVADDLTAICISGPGR